MLVFVLRCIAAGVGALLILCAAVSFGLFIAFEGELWRERATRFGAWVRLLALAWFNTEVWGRVVYTLFHWVK